MSISDFGCGSGQLVSAFGKLGLDVYGVDIKPFWLENPQFTDTDRMKVILTNPYRLPYEDETFDCVTSTSVFEHVFNHEECFREIHRVLRVDGFTMHLFPGPWVMPVEPHIFVPLASIIKSKWWLSIWALIGIRNSFQKGKSWREVVELNYKYCKTGINYIPRKKIKNMVLEIFGNVTYPAKEYIRHSPGRAAKLGRVIRLPLYNKLVFTTREQLIFAVKNKSKYLS